ncbi:hypothetical protein [Mesorhizobium sp. ORM16]|uniref:hypothetical protein n=1 Tax=Mesorhizobium sp. ORM16 TaxID=3376989 RepID=UPI003857520C
MITLPKNTGAAGLPDRSRDDAGVRPGVRGWQALVWVCHVLEHQLNPNAFLRPYLARLRPGGFLVTVPPMKNQFVNGDVSLWNAGLLLYHLIFAGFGYRHARVGTYASGPGYPVYNISVVANSRGSDPPASAQDAGDIERLADSFPRPVRQGFDGRLSDMNW